MIGLMYMMNTDTIFIIAMNKGKLALIFVESLTVLLLSGAFSQAAGQVAADAGIRWISDRYRVSKPVSLIGLEHWKPHEKTAGQTKWINKDGKLILDLFSGKPKNYASVSLVSKKEYGNFILDFTWIAEKGSNSGIKYRFKDFGGNGWLGCEYQILDDPNNGDGKKENGRNSAASLYNMFAPDPAKKKLNSYGNRNTGRIVVLNNHAEHWLNGEKVLEYEIGDEDWKKAHASSKFAGAEDFGKNPKGLLLVQDHDYPITFETITVREIGGQKASPPFRKRGIWRPVRPIWK
jgi:hypothetical protein